MFNRKNKNKSIEKAIIKSASICIIIVILIVAAYFYIFVEQSVNMKLIEINIHQREQARYLLTIVRTNGALTIISIIITTVLLIISIYRKMLGPVKKITEATKKVAAGDFTVELETERQDELGELTHNFNQMVKELNSIECLQKDFINNVSHEIKTPISSIQGFAKLLEDDNLTAEERKEYAGIIAEESNRLLYLTTNMLKLAKLENQERLTNKTEFSIAEQIRKVISILEPKWKEKNITFNVSLKEINFYGESDLLFQMWMNIIENSIKFSKQDGQIYIKMTENNEFTNIEIKDIGIGMTEDEKEKIFDRFYQIDKSHSGEGSGLGLAIVKRIIDLSGGKIEVNSEKNKGTTFKIILPKSIKEDKKIIIK